MKIVNRLLTALARRSGFLDFIRRQKQPKMIWGYRDSSGKLLDKVRISDTAYLYHPERITLGNNTFVWHYSILDGTGGLEIGEGTQIGAWVGIFTHSSHLAIRLYGSEYTNVSEEEKRAYPMRGVKIGRFVFIGAAAKILPGVIIGDSVVISAGAIVSKNIPPYAIVAGNPARVVGDVRDGDKAYLEKYPELRKTYVIKD